MADYTEEQRPEEELHHCNEAHEKEEPHECPYAVEIHGNTKLCTCCKACEHQCAMDI